MDGAGFVSRFIYITLPHLARAITVVILIQTIFLLARLRRDPGHHQWRPGLRLHQPALPRLPARRCWSYEVGRASAGGIIAVILANIVAFFPMRAVGKNLDK